MVKFTFLAKKLLIFKEKVYFFPIEVCIYNCLHFKWFCLFPDSKYSNYKKIWLIHIILIFNPLWRPTLEKKSADAHVVDALVFRSNLSSQVLGLAYWLVETCVYKNIVMATRWLFTTGVHISNLMADQKNLDASKGQRLYVLAHWFST